MVAEAEAVAMAEGSIWTTDNARTLGAAGVASPGHAVTGNLQELGNTSQSPPVKSGVVRLTAKDQADVGTDAPTKGANEHLAEEVAGGRGQPETIGEGLTGVV
jgi:hypothetical protein